MPTYHMEQNRGAKNRRPGSLTSDIYYHKSENAARQSMGVGGLFLKQ